MERFEVRTDGYGRRRAFDLNSQSFVGRVPIDAADAAALVDVLNRRGSAPEHDESLPDQLTLDELTIRADSEG
jgi:hypothetical protein